VSRPSSTQIDVTSATPQPDSRFSFARIALPRRLTNIHPLKMKGSVERVSPVWNDSSRRAGLIPHDQPVGHLVYVLPAFCPQIAPSGPFLPVMPVRKYCAVCILRFELLHGMEEVIGSIPIRSTN